MFWNRYRLCWCSRWVIKALLWAMKVNRLSWIVKLVSVIRIDNFQQFEDHICIYDLQQIHTIISFSLCHFILVCKTGAFSVFLQFFYSFSEQYITLQFCRILNAFSKVPPKPKIPSVQRYMRYCANQLDTQNTTLIFYGSFRNFIANKCLSYFFIRDDWMLNSSNRYSEELKVTQGICILSCYSIAFYFLVCTASH
jgi:hypothetical protein